MRFSSDSQRKAMFANMMSGSVSGLNRVKFSKDSDYYTILAKSLDENEVNKSLENYLRESFNDLMHDDNLSDDEKIVKGREMLDRYKDVDEPWVVNWVRYGESELLMLEEPDLRRVALEKKIEHLDKQIDNIKKESDEE